MGSGDSSPRPPTAPPSALERYLSHLAHGRRLAARTVTAYRRDGELLADLAGERDPAALGPHDIRRFIAKLHAGGLSPRSLARTLSAWRGFYDWLARQREVASNPCAGIRPPKAARTLPETLSPDEAVRLVTAEDDSDAGVRDRALFELAYSSGLRLSELAGLDVDRVDLAQGEVRVLVFSSISSTASS